MGGEVGANVAIIYAYGVRNCFGMAVDPHTGDLWNAENGDDSFDEINRITAGQNNGWVQVMGPVSRVAEFKMIETTPPFVGLQQIRWPATNIADTPAEVLSRLVRIPGSHYSDPQFSWKYAVAPAGIGFLNSRALGREYEGNLFVGAARTNLDAGYLMRFTLQGNRKALSFSDPRLADGVADNGAKFDRSESESLRFGTGFGVGTHIETGPNGNLYVVSLSDGAVYEIYRAQ
jgi:glucose/arabinose dehydrogenase